MQNLDLAMSSAVEKIQSLERKRESFSSMVRDRKPSLSLNGSPLFQKVQEKPLTGSIAGVDGGLLVRSLHGMELVLCKTAGVVFTYSSGDLIDSSYFPSPFPPVQPRVLHRLLSGRDSDVSAGIYRQLSEIRTARQMCEKQELELMVLHGSVIPHASARSFSDPAIKQEYLDMMQEYKRLYKVCMQKSISLLGVVEDTRGERFSGVLSQALGSSIDTDVLSTTRDTHLLSYLLDPGERTAAFPFSGNPKDHPVLRDLDDFADSIHTFYLRPVAFDRPIKVDFLGSGNAEQIASTLLPLCVSSQVYGMPSVIIEADARARLSGSEMELVYNRFVDKLGPLQSLQRLRRDMRPF